MSIEKRVKNRLPKWQKCDKLLKRGSLAAPPPSAKSAKHCLLFLQGSNFFGVCLSLVGIISQEISDTLAIARKRGIILQPNQIQQVLAVPSRTKPRQILTHQSGGSSYGMCAQDEQPISRGGVPSQDRDAGNHA